MQSNNQIHIQKKFTQTHLEGAVESGDFGNLVLNHFCFDSKEGGWVWFGLIWGGDSGVFFFPLWLRQFALLRNEWVSERVASWPHCAGLLILLRRFKREACGRNKTQNTSRHNTPQQCAENWPDFFATRLSLSLTVKQEVPQREKPCLVVYHVARSLCSQLDCNKQLRHACTCPTTGLAAVGSNICV